MLRYCRVRGHHTLIIHFSLLSNCIFIQKPLRIEIRSHCTWIILILFLRKCISLTRGHLALISLILPLT